jgi:acetyl-CoA synthetase
MIKARIKAENPTANLKSYYETYRAFSWSEVEKECDPLPGGELNIVLHAIDRWADDPEKRDRPALIFEKGGTTDWYSYVDLREKSCRWANVLARQGFIKGDRLFIFLPTTPEIYFAMLACARLGVIFSVLYPTLGFEETAWRIVNARPLGILTNSDLVEKLSPDAMKFVQNVLLTSGDPPALFSGEIVVEGLLERMPDEFDAVLLPRKTPLYLLYSSGSTGPPKGVVHAHQDMFGHVMTAKYVLNLNESSVLWTDGDAAWVTGTVYGAFAPWLCGATSIVQGDPFSASTWYRTLETHKVSVWYTTPATIRKLTVAGADLPGRYNFSCLNHVCTVGETLVPELFYWVKENLKHSAHDTWWMTETGMICIANFPSEPIKPGSMGKPVPGIEAAVIDSNGNSLPILTLGQLALKVGWPSMMTAIWQDSARYSQYFLGDWFLTGDMVIMDEDGYYYHQGRNDDLIKAGQEFIGPYEIEGVLRLHPAVGEAAVISKVGPAGTPFVKAFVTINKGITPSLRLNHELQAFVKTNLHHQLVLAEISFLDELPKTSSGKILRRVLRARELGLPSGDPLKLIG